MIQSSVPVNTRSAVKRTTIRTNIEAASLFEALDAPPDSKGMGLAKCYSKSGLIHDQY